MPAKKLKCNKQRKNWQKKNNTNLKDKTKTKINFTKKAKCKIRKIQRYYLLKRKYKNKKKACNRFSCQQFFLEDLTLHCNVIYRQNSKKQKAKGENFISKGQNVETEWKTKDNVGSEISNLKFRISVTWVECVWYHPNLFTRFYGKVVGLSARSKGED